MSFFIFVDPNLVKKENKNCFLKLLILSFSLNLSPLKLFVSHHSLPFLKLDKDNNNHNWENISIDKTIPSRETWN